MMSYICDRVENWESSLVKLAAWAIGAIGGAKLFETGLENYRKAKLKKIIRRHLYEELTTNYESVINRLSISSSIPGIKHGTAFRFRQGLTVRFQMQNQHAEVHKELFWSLPDIQYIDRVYAAFARINSPEAEYDARTESIKAAAAFEDAVVSKKLDRQLIKEVSSEPLWSYLQEIADGKHKGAKAAINPF